MTAIKELKAVARPRAGKGAARAERRAGRVPAVIYGEKQEPITISLDFTSEINSDHLCRPLPHHALPHRRGRKEAARDSA